MNRFSNTYGYHIKLSNSVFFNTEWKWNTVFFDQHTELCLLKAHKPNVLTRILISDTTQMWHYYNPP